MENQYRHLSLAERAYLENGIRDGLSLRFLAGKLGRAPSTLSRELLRNRLGPRTYRTDDANKAARKRVILPRVPFKLTHGPLWKYVVDGLKRTGLPTRSGTT